MPLIAPVPAIRFASKLFCRTGIPALLILGGAPWALTALNTAGLQHPESTAYSSIAPATPDLKPLADGRYRLRQPWTVELDGKRWTLPKGYTTNGITAPSYLKKRLGDGVQHRETWAAVFHDWLFTQPGISRAEADRGFHHLLLAYGVPAAKARLMYGTVAAYSLTRTDR